MENKIEISDVAVWFKHLHHPELVHRLKALRQQGEISLQIDEVVGRWQRMKTGKDGREVYGIRPVSAMKSVWNEWFKMRKGEDVEIKEVILADDYLAAAAPLFSEWLSDEDEDEDEEAFRDL